MPCQPAQPLRVALYARVSTDEQRDGQTIDSQVAELARFAGSQGQVLAGTYKDEGWSGKLLARPALDQLRDDASRGVFDAVLVNDVDRLARDVTHLGILRRDLERHGVRVIFRKLPGEASPTQNLLINVLGSFAEFERELIADRTRRGRRHKVEVRKQFLGSIASYGYRYIRRDPVSGREGVLEIDPAEAAVVRRIFAWVDEERVTGREVVRRLRAEGLRPRKGERWAQSSVFRLLRNETYAGVWYYYKHESRAPKRTPRDAAKTTCQLRDRADWLPLVLPEQLRLVERDRWERVQRQIDRNRAFSPRSSKHFYFLSGLVRCGGCRARYVGDPNHGHFAYRCWARCRKMPMIRERALDAAVWNAVAEAILKPEVIAAGVQSLAQDDAKAARRAAEDGVVAERALEQLQAEEDRLLEAYRLGVLSPTALGRGLDTVKRRRAGVENGRPAGTRVTVPPARSIAEYCSQAAQRLKKLTPHERREFLRLLVEDVVFEGTRIRIRGAIPRIEGDEGEPVRQDPPPHSGSQDPYLCGPNTTQDLMAYTASRSSRLSRVVFELHRTLVDGDHERRRSDAQRPHHPAKSRQRSASAQ